ncbi:chitin deacetylase [Entomophthora muscae]|uniref:Chitin deacetylase n=1 Tax=Entomophthora muscae TaxID=34485 RepID=A0ACC2TDQ5_9FUNG|nr:chitin deacetylase [Entomophthora muscae]
MCLGAIAAQFTSDNRCGSENNDLMCNPQGPYGGCCSKLGYCGSSSKYCSVDNGCQSGCTNVTLIGKEEPAKGCGDGFCDGRKETCDSCPNDCGVCQLKYLDKCVDPGEVTLTFDDGPDQFAPELLATAKKLNITLTLFVIGIKLNNATYREYLKEYYEAGHTIASHTYTHPFITKLTNAELREEMSQADDAIYRTIGKRPIFMRNPYSDSDQRTMALLDSMGYKSIFTSLDTEDTIFGNSDPSHIISNVVSGLKASPTNSSFTLTEHETYKSSVSSLPIIVAEIKRRGYTVVGLDKCYGTSGVYRKDTCGDGSCSGYIEHCGTCPKDCGACPKTA